MLLSQTLPNAPTHMPVAPSIRLVQFTDTHLQSARHKQLHGTDTLTSLQTVLVHATHRFPATDAVLLTGDLVQDDAQAYTQIRECFAPVTVPVLCLPGNHDLPDAMHTALNLAPFQVGGSLLLHPWLIVLLDTHVAGQAHGALGPAKLQQLDALLHSHPDQHALICLHHHPIDMHSRWLDTVGLTDAIQLRRLLAQHRTVRGVLWGHVHQALDRFINGIRYMATPATCAQFLPRSDHFALDSIPPGYRILELRPDGSIATEIQWAHAHH